MLKKFGWILVLMPFLAFSLGAEEPVLWGSQYSPGNSPVSGHGGPGE